MPSGRRVGSSSSLGAVAVLDRHQGACRGAEGFRSDGARPLRGGVGLWVRLHFIARARRPTTRVLAGRVTPHQTRAPEKKGAQNCIGKCHIGGRRGHRARGLKRAPEPAMEGGPLQQNRAGGSRRVACCRGSVMRAARQRQRPCLAACRAGRQADPYPAVAADLGAGSIA